MNTSHLNRRQFLQRTAVASLAAAALPRVLAQGDRKIVLALVGVAHIHTPGFVNLLKGRKDVKVKFVWDPESPRAAKPAADLGAEVVQDVNRIWSDPEIVAVVICSETNRHRDLVLAAARARKHMFAEKPLGTNARESLEMAEAIEKVIPPASQRLVAEWVVRTAGAALERRAECLKQIEISDI
ncbi:MAG TPA: Gfo/Idh/MocA family oxidoreductase, partial [Methylomirabilota bacterium]|nr:Gfo/Idh/MocA family oxidoreductase [Methylomirabilota bacterium]